ncbi:MAG: GTP 3',8-cyclase MoaA [Termitinemataceae bacterium]|nr:MAG: GTP 3',8-cyclase MoaA [Termitinemataceae bacterium]
MQDSFARNIDYLRVSITDRCNLRCIYCMPHSGVDWMPHSEMLSFEEILHICRTAANAGVKKIKVTGGEPLVRRGVVPFIAALKKIRGIESVSMTSNAFVLDTYLNDLLDAGLDAINISLDTLNEETFFRITNKSFQNVVNVLPLLFNSISQKKLTVKINCVPMQGINEDDIISVASLAKDNDIAVRFIELMPLGFAAPLTGIVQDKIFQMLQAEFGVLTPFYKNIGNGPAVYWTLKNFKGKIGFISPLSHVFCSSCNRMRLTATGLLKPCLSSDISIDLKTLLRHGASDDELQNAIQDGANKKPAQHTFTAGNNKTNMFKIGG